MRRARKHWRLYAMLALPLAYLLIFSYAPMYGVQIAFQDYSIRKGYWASPWVGFKHFSAFINGFYFSQLIRNTAVLSLYTLAAQFAFPVAFALLLNEARGRLFKKTVQTITYLPYFISTVVVVSMINQLFSNYGLINNLRAMMGAGQRVSLFTQESAFRRLYVWSDVWQRLGYSSIIYIAALSRVSPELYEAARMDGASRLRMIWHINLPAIAPTIVIMMILALGGVMNVGFEKVFLMQNQMNINVSRVISTYVYSVGLQGSQYSFSTAVNQFNAVINLLLLTAANAAARKVSDASLW
jgi:putative aldouronate transport system permease protein